jgi:hypothetical protein
MRGDYGERREHLTVGDGPVLASWTIVVTSHLHFQIRMEEFISVYVYLFI